MERPFNKLIEDGLNFLKFAYYPEDINITAIDIMQSGKKFEALFTFDKTRIMLCSDGKDVYWFFESASSGYYTSHDFYELFDQGDIIGLNESDFEDEDEDEDDFESAFEDWFEDGNVEEIEPNVYATQDAQWSNRIKGIPALKKYFEREFF